MSQNITQILSDLKRSVEISVKMQQFAELQQWEELLSTEQERQTILSGIFPLGDVTETEAQMLQPLLQQLIAANTQIEELCKDARDGFKLELSSLSKHKKAAAAYQTT